MRKRQPKLRLNRETVRQLTEDRLEGAAGGGYPIPPRRTLGLCTATCDSCFCTIATCDSACGSGTSLPPSTIAY